MNSIANTLKKFDFSVIIDGIKLYKPILLDGPSTEVKSGTIGKGKGPFHFPLDLDETVWGTHLKVRGYLYGSGGTALHPDDIRECSFG